VRAPKVSSAPRLRHPVQGLGLGIRVSVVAAHDDRRVGCDGQVIQVAAADGMAATVRTEVSALVAPRACSAILRNGQRCADSELLSDGAQNLVAFVRETPQRAQPSSHGHQVPQGEVFWAFLREIHAADHRDGRLMVGVRCCVCAERRC